MFLLYSILYLSIGRPLFYLAMHLFQEYELIQDFDLDIVKLMKFLSEFNKSFKVQVCLYVCTCITIESLCVQSLLIRFVHLLQAV